MPYTEVSAQANDNATESALAIIGEALGIEPDDFQDDETWPFLGLKGLLATATLKDLQDGLPRVSLPGDVFLQYPTVGSFKRFLQPRQPPLSTDLSQRIPKPKFALSIILQGDPKTCTKTMFLFPDGSGAGLSYRTLPPISPTICLIALNSPFLGNPASFTNITIPQLASLWLPELLSHQPPSQPFILGGWSAGGYYAYEACHLLSSSGHTIERLILIDSPCRLRYEALPVAVVDELTKKGYMGSSGERKAPEWLVKHFTATVLAVDEYMPKPLEKGTGPDKVGLLWAREGLVKDVKEAGLDVDLEVKVTRFLLEPRGELKCEGWEELVGDVDFSFRYLTGNHFQITQAPHVDHLGILLRGLLE